MITLEKVIAAALEHVEVLDTLGEALSSELVTASPFYRQLVGFAAQFRRTHHRLPQGGDYSLWLSTLPEGQQQGLQEALSRIKSQDLSGYTPTYVAEYAIEELRVVAAQNALSRLNEAVDPSPDLLNRLAEQVQRIKPRVLEGVVDLSNVGSLIDAGTDLRLVPTGISKLDDQLGGGIAPEFVILFADTGVGKTTTLANFARAMALHGGRVLHISFEVWTHRLAHRYYRAIAEVDRNEFYNDREKVLSRLQHHFRFAKGSTHLLYRPAYSMTPEELEDTVGLFVDTYGGVEAIILDYLDLMAPPASSKARSKMLRGDEILGQTSHLVRSFCSRYDTAVFSAGQSNSSGHGVKHLKLKNMGGAYSKNQAADIVMGLNQTEEEQQMSQARLQLLKVRDFPGRGREIPLYCDMDLQIVADLDSPNTRRLMEKRGIKPTQPVTEAD